MSGPLRVIGLVRVSTDEQAESGAGEAAQTDTLTSAAGFRGWDLEIVRELGYSAKDMAKRPILLEQLRRLDAGEADVLAIAKLDRLSRSVPDFASILKRAAERGWSVVALDLGVDTTTPTGKLVAQLVMAIAEWEREMIGLRTREALATRKKGGMRLGRRPTHRVSDEVRARIASERAAGASLRAIAAGLTADEVPTALGGQWEASTIRQVLAALEAV